MTIADGAIGPGGRFDRIEATLIRIEAKLDSKADLASVEAIDHRLKQVENGESPLAKVFIAQFTQMQSQLNDLTLHGSSNAQSAGKRVGDLEERTARVEELVNSQEKIATALRGRSTVLFRSWGMVLSVVSTAAIVISLVDLLSHVTH